MKSIQNMFVSVAAGLSVIVMLAGALVAVPAAAQELAPEHIALARKYVDMTDRAKIYEIALIQAGVKTLRVLTAQNPDIKEQANEAIGKTIEEYAKNKDDLFDQFARVYAVRFSMDELNEIIAFYETDTGKKLTALGIEINRDLQAVMKVFENNLNTEFYAKVRANLREQGIEL